jgi:hypothetical protein
MRTPPASKGASKQRSGDPERTVPRKGPLTGFIGEIESIRLTNGAIALTTRLVISGVLGIARLYQRNRSRW